jgi:hypothetical protein
VADGGVTSAEAAVGSAEAAVGSAETAVASADTTVAAAETAVAAADQTKAEDRSTAIDDPIVKVAVLTGDAAVNADDPPPRIDPQQDPARLDNPVTFANTIRPDGRTH